MDLKQFHELSLTVASFPLSVSVTVSDSQLSLSNCLNWKSFIDQFEAIKSTDLDYVDIEIYVYKSII